MTHEEIVTTLLDALGPGDDPELWELAAGEFLDSLGGRETGRHLIVFFARVPDRFRGGHADDHATLRLAWERDRGEAELRFAGESPRIRRRRGHYTATVCVPKGTRGLAFAAVEVLWRPRLPWAPPQHTSIGREELAFTRGANSRWHFRGMREVR